jgi:RNA polymerase-binding transcription factor DksA
MATKKPVRKSGGKKAPKKAAKPVKKAAAKKPAAKKSVKKPVPKKVTQKKKPVKTKVKKTAKVVAKPKPVNKAKEKPVVKANAAAKPEVQAPKSIAKKPGGFDPKSLVSIKQKVKPVIKKEPPKPSKIVIPKTTTKSSVKYEPEFTKSVLDENLYLPSTGPTQRYSDNDLAEFREIIQKKLDAAKKELSYLQGLITRKDEGGDIDEARYMTMEDGSVSMEREQLSQMASRQITFIDHLEKAMMWIENKTYGICRVTGRLIDKARLRAVPHATLSIEAKQMMNK